MRTSRLVLIVMLLALGCGIWWTSRTAGDGVAISSRKPGVKTAADSSAPATKSSTLIVGKKAAARGKSAKEKPPVDPELERMKEIDRDHMRKLHAGIFAYKAKHGNYPEYLSQLVPEFVSADTLISPFKKAEARDFADMDHPDPGVSQPSYGYEFSNLEFRDGRTFAEIKEVQRSEWGDAVPLLRCFVYPGTVMNMAYGGEIYETALNWEWDAATMKVVDKYGWGPGLDAGEMVKVRVTGADGQPVAGTKVWADGRNYSFDLPNRPYQTDADGYVSIPVGVDVDRTALVLRAEAPGQASATTRYPVGELPQDGMLTLAPAETVSGVLLDESGEPMADTRVYLKNGPADDSGTGRDATVTTVLTDAAGRWTAQMNAADLQGLSAVPGIPGGTPVTFSRGQPVDIKAAVGGTAVISVSPPQ